MTNTLLRQTPFAPAVGDATRRQFLAGLAAIGLLAACGDDQERTTGADATRTVTDFFGVDVQIPVEPRRIVSADDTSLANLLNLGITPVATAVNLLSVPTFLGARVDGIEDVSSADGPFNIEALAAVQPDLIFTLGVDFARDRLDLLRPIAPTFAYAYGFSTSEEIRNNMTELGRALGLEERAEAEVRRLDERVAGLRVAIADAGLAGEPVSVLRVGPGTDGNYSIRHGSLESVLMAELGMTRPPNQRSIEDFATDLSFERVDAVDGYALYVYVDTGGDASLRALTANPLWPTLDVVRNERVFMVDGGAWNAQSLGAAHVILDDIERTLLP